MKISKLLSSLGLAVFTLLLSVSTSFAATTTTVANETELQDTINAAAAGDVVEFTTDITLSKQIDVNTDGVVIDGMGNTLYASFAKTSNSNNAALTIYGNDVTIQNLIIDGSSGIDLHGLNTYKASNLYVDNVTSMNFRTGVNVNGSTVTVNNITTKDNSWGGINVDLGSNVNGPAVLTVNGISFHNEATHIWMDDYNKAVSVIDTNNQYTSQDYGTVRVYTWKYAGPPAMPTGMRILDHTGADLACEGVTNNRNITVDWDDNTETDFANYDYRIKEGNIIRHPVNSEVSGAIRDLDGYYKYSVRAVDTAGNFSEWSDWCGVTLDREAPEAPMLVEPTDMSVVTGDVLLSDWTDVDDAVKYIYNSYHDEDATNSRYRKEYTQSEKTAYNVANTTFWWRVKAVDAAGNESEWSDLWKVTIDNDAPVVDITSHENGDVLQGTVEVRGSVEDDNPWRYYAVVKNSDGNVVAGPRTVYENESFTDKPLFDFDTTTVKDGTYTLWLAARDAANNRDNSVSLEVVEVEVNNTPDTKDECKKDDWMNWLVPKFKNQGECVSYLMSNSNAGKRN